MRRQNHSEEVLFSRLGDEGVTLHLKTGVYYSLNETATPIWEMISNLSEEQMAHRLVEDYEVDFDRALQSVKSFLESTPFGSCKFDVASGL